MESILPEIEVQGPDAEIAGPEVSVPAADAEQHQDADIEMRQFRTPGTLLTMICSRYRASLSI